MKNKATLSDVAARAKVSAITVSRYLRAPEKVAEKTAARIKLAIDELGYIPNYAAQALASSSSNVIGVIIPSLSNTVFTDVVAGLYEALEGSPYTVQFAHTSYSPLEEERVLKLFRAQNPAAMIVAGIDQTAESTAILKSIACPVVQLMDMTDEPIDSIIGFSHFEAARDATEQLLALGYRRIGFIGARMDPRTQKRLKGFRSALENAKLLDESRIITSIKHSSLILGGQMLAELLGKTTDLDAIFCNNDDLAVGALFECYRRGIRVPEDLAICGFNNFAMTEASHPQLTSVDTHRYEMGRRAGLHILDRLRTGSSRTLRLDLGTEFIRRGSV